MVVTYKLVTEVLSLTRRDFAPNSRNYVNPEHADVILMGEYVQLNAAYKLIRGAGGDVYQVPTFSEQGRSDSQAIADGGITVLYLGSFEADTLIFDSSSPPALGAKLGVDASVTYTFPSGATKTVSGLATYSSGYEAGYVTRTAATNNDYLRYVRV